MSTAIPRANSPAPDTQNIPKSEEAIVRAKLTWLKITKFRNVAPTTLRFDGGCNLILGKNGAGKTTLLNLLSACVRGDFSEWASSVFDVEWEILIGSFALQCRLQNRSSSPYSPSNTSTSLSPSYEVPPSGGSNVVSDESATGFFSNAIIKIAVNGILHPKALHLEELEPPVWMSLHGEDFTMIHALPLSPMKAGFVVMALGYFMRDIKVQILLPPSPVVVASAALGNLASGAIRVDESLGLLTHLEKPVDTPYRMQVDADIVANVLHHGMTNFRMWKFVPMELVDLVGAKLAEMRRSRADEDGQPVWGSAVDVEATGFHPLFVFLRAVGLSRAWVSIEIDSIHPQGAGDRLLLRGYVFRFQRGRSTFRHHDLSYGQKRLLSFLFYVACNEHVVIADELVNGLHHDWIELCLDEIGDRQAFLTSQNPILLDYLPPASAEQAERQYVQCLSENGEGGEQKMIWKNLGEADAARFYEELSTGIMQASELLRIRGLW